VDIADYDYDLPETRIAQVPVEPRCRARLLTDLPAGVQHRFVHELADLFAPGDLVVVNETRVLPARLHLVKDTGGAAEVLLLEERTEAGEGHWEALVRPGRRLPPGTVLRTSADSDLLSVIVGDRLDHEGRRAVVLRTDQPGGLEAAIEAAGEIPLPPYIHTALADTERYQTVYAEHDRAESVAAPTAGLHLTPDVLDRITAREVGFERVELAVGLGTFRPITAGRVEDHHMHTERYRVHQATLDACVETRRRGGRVTAIGTTTVRALESAAATGRLEGRTDLFIRPGFPFQLVDRLMTNFHQPRSSLLVMIDAFVGANPDGSRHWRDLYREALGHDYRFLSFGDAMFLTRHDHWDRRG
jgi:S-adenosylmethionine:tRNA ribosyltransferase-isomerase